MMVTRIFEVLRDGVTTREFPLTAFAVHDLKTIRILSNQAGTNFYWTATRWLKKRNESVQ